MNSRSSCAPECTNRKPTWENCALPPDSCLGAFSTITTFSAPDCLAAIAASSAALPPPMTMTSQVVFGLIFLLLSLASAVGKVLVAQLRLGIGQCALGHPEGDAHLGKADADRLGVEHMRAGRFREVIGIDHVGNERAAERQNDLG